MIKIGDVIDNKTLCELFGVANSGGMRRSLDNNLLVIVADWTKRGVTNRWDGEVLHYVGQGQGDQKIEKQNRTLARSRDTGERIHLFEVSQPGKYAYRGQVELAGEPYQERQPDARGVQRDAWVFPLRRKRDDEDGVSLAPSHPLPDRLHLPHGVFATIDGELTGDQRQAVNDAVDALRAIGVTIVDRRDIDEQRHRDGLTRWHAEVLAHMRGAAIAAVERVRKSAETQRRAWTMKPDEVGLDPGCDEGRIREVLSIVGCGDEFDRIHEDAMRRVAMPDPPASSHAGPMSPEDEAELRAAIAQRKSR